MSDGSPLSVANRTTCECTAASNGASVLSFQFFELSPFRYRKFKIPAVNGTRTTPPPPLLLLPFLDGLK